MARLWTKHRSVITNYDQTLTSVSSHYYTFLSLLAAYIFSSGYQSFSLEQKVNIFCIYVYMYIKIFTFHISALEKKLHDRYSVHINWVSVNISFLSLTSFCSFSLLRLSFSSLIACSFAFFLSNSAFRSDIILTTNKRNH